jgi:hypothetical protein
MVVFQIEYAAEISRVWRKQVFNSKSMAFFNHLRKIGIFGDKLGHFVKKKKRIFFFYILC